MNNKYEDLIDATDYVMSMEKMKDLRGISVDWNDNTIVLVFYHNGNLTEEQAEDYSCIATEILSHFGTAFLSENIECIDYPKPLPNHKYWGYKSKSLFSVQNT